MFVQVDYARSLAYFDAAIETFSRLDETLEVGITLSSTLRPLANLDRDDELNARTRRARRIFSKQNDRLRMARLETNYGTALSLRDRWQEASEAFKRAHEDFMVSGESPDVAASLINIAVSETQLGDLPRAQLLLEKAKSLSERHGLKNDIALADFNAAYVQFLLGDYKGALVRYESARRHFTRAGHRALVAQIDLDESELLLELCLVKESALLATKAASVFRRLRLEYELAKSRTVLGLCARWQGRSREAAALYAEARKSFETRGNEIWCTTLDIHLAALLLETGRVEECHDLVVGLPRLTSGTLVTTQTVQAQLLFARVLLARGDAEEAKSAAELAIRKISYLDRNLLESQAYLIFAQALEACGNLRTALETYEKSAQVLENLTGHLPPLGMRSSFLVDKASVYEAIFVLSNQAGKTDAAFLCLEKAKSSALAELVTRAGVHVRRSALAASNLPARSRVLRARLRGLETRIRKLEQGDPVGGDEIDRLRRAAIDVEWKLQHALGLLEDENLDHGYQDCAAIPTISEVREELPEDTSLLEYYFARGQLFCLVLGKERGEIVELGTVAGVKKAHNLFCLSMASDLKNPHPTASAATKAHLHELHETLMQPILGYLQGSRLLAIPHGFLHQIPFSALYDGCQYVAERFAVFTAPSSRIFLLAQRKRTTRARESLVVGVPDEQVPNILREVNAVANLLPASQLILGKSASAKAISESGARARFIHIATHSYFRKENPLFSAVQLGDGSFNVHDFYSQDWDAELVVLSGCSTGMLSIQGGDEILGLARGLFAAGARSMLISLWNVNDEATADFMSSFYLCLLRGETKDRALNEAMRKTREQRPHPYYWAAFTLLGDPRSLPESPPPERLDKCQPRSAQGGIATR